MIIQGVPFSSGSGSGCGPGVCPVSGAEIGLSPCMTAFGQYSPVAFASGISQVPNNCGPSYLPNPFDQGGPVACEQLAEPIEKP